MVFDLEVGLMRNIETHNYGDPYKVIKNISLSEERGLDVLVGPEWSLTHEPNILLYENFKDKDPREIIEGLFDFHKDLIYAPEDAKRILERLLDEGRLKFKSKLYPSNRFRHKFRNMPQNHSKSRRFMVNGVKKLKVMEPPSIPYSKREYLKLIGSIKEQTRNSDMLVIPGTAMYYDKDLRLYNAAPVVHSGRISRTFYKFKDGGGSSFNLNGMLKISPDQYDNIGFEPYGRDPLVHFKGKRIGVEICADSGVLKTDYGVDDLDLQVLVSCGISGYLDATRKGGYIAIMDGCKEMTRSVKSGGNTLRPTRRYPEMDVFTLRYE